MKEMSIKNRTAHFKKNQYGGDLIHSNTYWYVGLSLLSLFLLSYVYFKVRDKKIFLLLLAMIGFGFMIEGFIYNLLQSYWYYPHFIKDDATFDSNLGAIASNALVLPICATYIATLTIKKRWIFLLTSMIIGIEWLFLKLEVYSHNWWRLEFTALGLVLVYFPFSKRLYHRLKSPMKGLPLFFVLFLLIGPFIGSLHIFPIMFLHTRLYDLGWYRTLSEDTNAFAMIYYLMSSLFITSLATYQWKLEWLKYPFIVFCYSLLTYILLERGILQSFVWWDKLYYILLPLFMFVLAKRFCQTLQASKP
jgi:hypothetical protein